MSTLSVIIPVLNEERTIITVIRKVAAAPLPDSMTKQIIIVDDCSTDKTGENVQQHISSEPGLAIDFVRHEMNKGKGAAIRTGLELAKGDYTIIQDADLEYDPEEYSRLLKPMLDGHADVVFGSRFVGGNAHRILFFWHSIGNKFLTFLSNMLTNLNLTDMESCYKLFKTDLLKGLDLQEQRFGFEPEVTAKIAKIRNVRIYEVGVSYYGRTYAEGKKIGWRDGINAVYCILKYNILK